MNKQQLIRRLQEQAPDLVPRYSAKSLRCEVTLHVADATIRVTNPYRSFTYIFRSVKFDPFDGTILSYERGNPMP